MKGAVKTLNYDEAVAFLLPRHYSGRVPSISVAFGWYIENELVAVCSFGKPASPSLCRGLAGDEYASSVYELNRLCRMDTLTEPLSAFVAACLRRLRSKNWIIVSYADTDMEHHGYIYQACNFIYTGQTKQRTDKYTKGNKHSRHYSMTDQNGLRKVRSAKHRYIYFCTYDKRKKDKWIGALKYPICPYPKGQNRHYTLGTYLQPKIVLTDKGHSEPTRYSH
jgi:hypothetical protein